MSHAILISILLPIITGRPLAIGPGAQGYAASEADIADTRRRREEYQILPWSPPKQPPITIAGQ